MLHLRVNLHYKAPHQAVLVGHLHNALIYTEVNKLEDPITLASLPVRRLLMMCTECEKVTFQRSFYFYQLLSYTVVISDHAPVYNKLMSFLPCMRQLQESCYRSYRNISKSFKTYFSSVYTFEGFSDIYSLLNNLNFPVQIHRLPPIWTDSLPWKKLQTLLNLLKLARAWPWWVWPGIL